MTFDIVWLHYTIHASGDIDDTDFRNDAVNRNYYERRGVVGHWDNVGTDQIHSLVFCERGPTWLAVKLTEAWRRHMVMVCW